MKYSFVIPVYGSGGCVREIVAKIRLLQLDAEVIFVDDRGGPLSWPILQMLCSEAGMDVTAIRLSSNFGQHNALMCGFSHAKGDVLITLDDDLQNPIEEVPKLLAALQEGIDVVYGIPLSKQHNWFRNIGSNIIQMVYQKTFSVPTKISSFRAIRGHVAKGILRYNKNFTYIDGLLAWHTKSSVDVGVRHEPRAQGRSGYSMQKLLNLAINVLTNFSLFPLQVMSIAGVSFAVLSFTIGTYLLSRYFLVGIPVPGYTSLIICITFLSGVQLIALGLLGEYLGRVLINVNEKPQFVVSEMRTNRTDAVNP
jgi:glycosyltransferase involved in cell wall biosynthesis